MKAAVRAKQRAEQGLITTNKKQQKATGSHDEPGKDACAARVIHMRLPRQSSSAPQFVKQALNQQRDFVVFQLADTRPGEENKVRRRQGGSLLPEAFPAESLDSVTFYGVADVFLRHHQAQTGTRLIVLPCQQQQVFVRNPGCRFTEHPIKVAFGENSLVSGKSIMHQSVSWQVNRYWRNPLSGCDQWLKA